MEARNPREKFWLKSEFWILMAVYRCIGVNRGCREQEVSIISKTYGYSVVSCLVHQGPGVCGLSSHRCELDSSIVFS